MINSIATYSRENGGRVIVLFLLFLLSLYELTNTGLNAFSIVCLSPAIILVIYIAFKWKLFFFWLLIIINWFIQFKNISFHIPTSLADELLEILLITIAIIDARYTPKFGRASNLMLVAISIWSLFCIVELFNDTCNLGINFGAWFSGARLMALQLLWIVLVFSLYITNPQTLLLYFRIWACLSLISAFWTWKMINFGFTTAENIFLDSGGRVTHIINGGTLTRYWSTFSDAANYGCNASASAIAFFIFGITSKVRKDKLFFIITSIIVTWGMFQSGTRTAIFTMIGGFILYMFLSKSFKIIIPGAIIGTTLLALLIFTDIGSGNQQIRRMRSAFNKEDASANVRDINKAAISKYLKDAPWGIGIGMYSDNIPAWNRYKVLSQIPPDSEYVFIWVRTGPIGVTVFTCCMILILLGGCYIVLFKLKSRSLIGIGGGLCCAFFSIQLGGYANQVLYQYPNGLTFFGGMAIVYLLPFLEKEWIKYEERQLAEEQEKRLIKLEKKLASRV